ncbi:hypothetical protein DM01DRAFT_1332952, partial [Hesseltinella vesiculosa]
LNAARSIPMTLQERQRESVSLNLPPPYTTSPSLAPHDSQTLQHDQWILSASVFSFTRKPLVHLPLLHSLSVTI